MQVLHFSICPLIEKELGSYQVKVHNIIEKISIENNYSQSKVTRILVEEALMSRGVLGNSFKNNSNIGKENISLKIRLRIFLNNL